MIASLLLALLLQTQPAASAPAAKHAAPVAFSLEVLTGNKVSLSVPEEGVLIADIVAGLKEKLKVPVTLSQALATTKLKSGFALMPLEEALTRLAPRAYLDYRATGGPKGTTTLNAIVLQGAVEAAPPLPPESHTSLVFEGVVGDPTVETLQPDRDAVAATKILELPTEGPYVRTSYQAGLVTVRAHDRSPAAIGGDLAERLGVAFTLHSGFDAGPIDLEIIGVALDDLARWLPPNMSVMYRREASTRELMPLRILMGEAPAGRR